MNAALEAALLPVSVVFCRIGACFLLLPGFAGPRIPMQIRLLIAIAMTLAALPLVGPGLSGRISASGPLDLVTMTLGETAVGICIGLMCRVFFAALRFAGMLVSNLLGLVTMPDPGIDDDEPSTPLADLIILASITLMMVLGLHFAMVEAVVGSYAVLPAGALVGAEFALERVVAATAAAFALAVEISAPFIVYGFVANGLLAIANRWVPQIPVQFISAPALLFGGLAVAYVSLPLMVEKFLASFSRWLAAM